MELLFRLIPLAALLGAGGAAADDLSAVRDILCSTQQVHVCRDAAGCEDVLAADLNIPQFLRIDTRAGKLSTTPASGENRETAAGSVSRADGQLVLQGVEAGRAFSLFIDEASGWATFAAAANGRSVTVFAACTPATAGD
jgi:hypothetical protein